MKTVIRLKRRRITNAVGLVIHVTKVKIRGSRQQKNTGGYDVLHLGNSRVRQIEVGITVATAIDSVFDLQVFDAVRKTFSDHAW